MSECYIVSLRVKVDAGEGAANKLCSALLSAACPRVLGLRARGGRHRRCTLLSSPANRIVININPML